MVIVVMLRLVAKKMIVIMMAMIKIKNSKENWQYQKVRIWLSPKKLLEMVLQDLNYDF